MADGRFGKIVDIRGSKTSKLMVLRLKERTGSQVVDRGDLSSGFVSTRTLTSKQYRKLLATAPEHVLSAKALRGGNPLRPTRFTVRLAPEAALNFPNTPHGK